MMPSVHTAIRGRATTQENLILTGQPQNKLWLPYLREAKLIEETSPNPAVADQNDVKNKIHSHNFIIPTTRTPESATVKPYSLETIMALQKALEAGIDPDEKISPVQPQKAQERTSVRPGAVSALVQRFSKSVTSTISRLGQRLKFTFARKKQSRPTSAR